MSSALATYTQNDGTANLWQRCLQHLRTVLPEKQIRTWLQPLQVDIAPNEQQLKIYVPSRYKLDYIRTQYDAIIQKSLEHLQGQVVSISFQVGVPNTSTPPAAPPTSPKTASPRPVSSVEDFGLSDAAPTSQAPSKTPSGHNIHANLTFESLVEGSANRMARAAGLHIASHEGAEYNPLFIYGASGLGKTHLLHAIGNAFMQNHEGSRVLYVHASKFVSDVVKACRYNQFDAFKQQYHSLDLLLIDDVQEFSGKDKTMEEFFASFNTLLEKHSRIILTSDTYPKDLVEIPDRLISRFVSGLTVGLEPPNLEMRVAILLRKAELSGVDLPQDVAFFIAKNVQSNVRELEGALRNVLAYARFKGVALDIVITREALKDLLSAHHRQITIENIQKIVADFYRIKIADMHSKRRPANIAKPRQIAMYLAKEMTQKSLPEIGAAFGGRDHTTVLHAVRKINKDRQSDSQLNQNLHLLEQSLKT